MRCLKFLFILSLLMPLATSFAQGLIPLDDSYLRQRNDELMLTEKDNHLFGGYMPTFFERKVWRGDSLVRSAWFDKQFQSKPYFFRPSLQFVSYREREVRASTIGTAEHPVFYSTLLEGAQGLTPRYGENAAAAIDGELRPTDWAFGKVKVYGGLGVNEPQAWYFIQQLYAEFRFNSLVLSVGRKPIRWGQSALGPILYSDNARSLDLIEISTLPVQWPWIFKYLGDLKAEVFVSRLDDKRSPANDWFAGWRVGMKPADSFEANIAMIYQLGGEGTATGTFSDYLVEFLGIRKSYSSNPHDSSNFTNRAIEGDVRLNFQYWAWPTSFYTEQHLEDCCGKIGALFTDTLSYNFGVFTKTGQNTDAHRLRLEFSKLGTNIYFHSTWPSTTSNGQRIAGSPLGRDGQTVSFEWSREFLDWKSDISLRAFWQQRDRRDYISEFDDGAKIMITSYRPDFKQSEKRYGMRPAAKILLGRESFLDTALELVRVTGKENSERETWEWGLFTGISRSW